MALLQLIGPIKNPLVELNPTKNYGNLNTGGAGLGGFIGNIINLIAIAGGLFALFNLVTAGISYISSGGDPKGIEEAKSKIFMSIIGLVIIVSAFSLIAVISMVLFGRWDAIIHPTIKGPGNLSTGVQ